MVTNHRSGENSVETTGVQTVLGTDLACSRYEGQIEFGYKEPRKHTCWFLGNTKFRDWHTFPGLSGLTSPIGILYIYIYMHTYCLTAWHSGMYLWGVSVPGWLALGRDGLSLVDWLLRVCPLR